MITFSKIGYAGRLGNQMFQYASLCGIAKQKGCDWGIPYSNSKEWKNVCGCESKLFLNEIFEITAKDSSNMKMSNIVKWDDLSYNKSFVDYIENDMDIHGYLQSEKYFIDNTTLIRKEFVFKNKTKTEQAKEEYSKLGFNKIAIHIRRGDYTTSHSMENLVVGEYHKKAVDFIERQTKENGLLVIFSDDIDWCKKEMPNIFPNNRIIFDEPPKTNSDYFNNQEESLIKMTLCDHFVIANSSYSWWGAWLSYSSSKIITAPRKWFVGIKNAEDMYGEGWVIL